MKVLLLIILTALPLTAWPVIETYQFNSDELRLRYQQFTQELRCPKCQNQNLSGSNSPIAKDLRRELHRLLQEGFSDQQINEFMVQRYGEFVLYRPRLNQQTLLLWAAPVLFLLFSVIALVRVIRHQRVTALSHKVDSPLTEAEQQRINKLLEDSSGKDTDND